MADADAPSPPRRSSSLPPTPLSNTVLFYVCVGVYYVLFFSLFNRYARVTGNGTRPYPKSYTFLVSVCIFPEYGAARPSRVTFRVGRACISHPLPYNFTSRERGAYVAFRSVVDNDCTEPAVSKAATSSKRQNKQSATQKRKIIVMFFYRCTVTEIIVSHN